MALKIPKDARIVKTLRLPADMTEKLSLIAQRKDLSFNKVVEICLEYALENYEDDDEKPIHVTDYLLPKKKTNKTKKDE